VELGWSIEVENQKGTSTSAGVPYVSIESDEVYFLKDEKHDAFYRVLKETKKHWDSRYGEIFDQ
jgi:aspartate aminotransferase-like enzyme